MCHIWFVDDTHIFIGGLVGADKVGMEAREPYDGPDGEEAHHHLQHGDSMELRNKPRTASHAFLHLKQLRTAVQPKRLIWIQRGHNKCSWSSQNIDLYDYQYFPVVGSVS